MVPALVPEFLVVQVGHRQGTISGSHLLTGHLLSIRAPEPLPLTTRAQLRAFVRLVRRLSTAADAPLP